MISFIWLALFERKYFLIIQLIFIILTCISVSIIQRQAQNPSSLNGQEKRWPSALDINSIMEMNIFGIRANPIIKKNNGESVSCHSTEKDEFYLMVPKTKSEKSIRALVISTQAHHSVAVIDILGHQKLFSQGDNLGINGEKLVRVLSDRVIIRKDGYCTALIFAE